jgi:hypothetical protein
MSTKRPAAEAAPPEPEESESKAQLRRQMEQARESISDTVAEIKSVVTHQYEEVRDTVETVRAEVGEVLDWRTEFERNPRVWGAGAVSIGILIGFGIAHAFDDEEKTKGGRKKRTTGGHIVSELSGFADVVLPTISSKVKELFGLDLDAYLRAERERRPAASALASKNDGAPKRSGTRAASKAGTKKSGTKKAASKKRAR